MMSHMPYPPSRDEIEALRKKYPPGTMLRLIRMVDDPNPVEPGTIGEIITNDDAGHLIMRWQNGRSLSLIAGVDEFEVLPTCPKCGKQYAERPAMSRIDSLPICRMCGYKEAVAFLPDEMQDDILRAIQTAEEANGDLRFHFIP